MPTAGDAWLDRHWFSLLTRDDRLQGVQESWQPVWEFRPARWSSSSARTSGSPSVWAANERSWTPSTHVFYGPLGSSASCSVCHSRYASYSVVINGSSVPLTFFVFVTSLAIQVVTILLLGHTVYRIIETASGMGGVLFQHETAFMLINGVVPLLACILLTAFPPGAVSDTTWSSTSARFRSKHNLQPLPLPPRSPKSPYSRYRDARTSPHQRAGLNGASEEQQQQHHSQVTPTSAGSMPLHQSTMSTAVRNNPVTQTTTQQPNPVARTQRQSPTYWRDQQHHLQYGKPSPTSSQTVVQQSPSQSPTFQPTGQRQQHSPGLASEYVPVPSSRRTSMKTQPTQKELVDSDSLW